MKFPTIDRAATGCNLRKLMLERNISVPELQKYLGLSSFQSIYHWLSGRSLPSIDNIYALSELFQVPMDEIIKGERTYRPYWNKHYDAALRRIAMYMKLCYNS